MITSDVMSTSPRVITLLTTIGEAAVMMRDHDVGFLPVVDLDQRSLLLGVVTDRDLVVRGLAEGHDIDSSIRFVMSGPPLVVARPSTPVHELLRLMERHQVRRIPVVADGHLRGVVSQGDLALRLGPSEPAAIEELLERVSAPAWMVPFLDGSVRLPHPHERA